jgi:hypothetical protein
MSLDHTLWYKNFLIQLFFFAKYQSQRNSWLENPLLNFLDECSSQNILNIVCYEYIMYIQKFEFASTKRSKTFQGIHKVCIVN